MDSRRARRATALLGPALFASWLSFHGFAAHAEAPAQASEPAPSKVEEIVVTISKRDEPLQRIAAAVSAFDSTTPSRRAAC